jgi:PTH1 family peptidyl-tRNA hydrolase
VLAYRWNLPPFRRAPRAYVARGTVAGCPIALLKPRTFMNDSGAALEMLLAEPGFAPARDLLVLVDDVALPLGTFRLRARGSAGGHHGLESLEAALGSPAYARLRIGIGPAPAGMDDLAEFVLAPFARAEATAFQEVLPLLGDAVECWITDGIEAAMNRFNRRAEAGSGGEERGEEPS